MSAQRKRLTKRTVSTLVSKHARYLVRDDEVRGFLVEVHPSGERTFKLEYSHRARTRRATIGRFPDLTADEARRRALELRGYIARGGDPQAEQKAQRRAEPTVREAVKAFLADADARVERGRLAESTRRQYEQLLEKDVLSSLGSRTLRSLEYADARRLHSRVSRRAPVTANRVLKALSALWSWASREAWVEGPNPTQGVERNAERARQRHLTDKQLAKLGEALSDATPEIRALVRLILFTGCRPGEILRLEWDRIDDAAGQARIDGKTGERLVCLNEPARKALVEVPHRPSARWVFPSPRDRAVPRGDFRKAWRALLKAAKIRHTGKDLDPYVLRHTFASKAEAQGLSPFVIAALLGHSTGRLGITSTYVHHLAEDVRKASERVGAALAGALRG